MQNRFNKSWLPVVLLLLAIPCLAQANPGLYGTGFSHGLLHPLTGFDHICAMLAVGLWAAQRGGNAIWIVPSAFVGMMFLGGLLGEFGMPLPQVEVAIMASVLSLGLLVAAAIRLPVWLSSVIAGVFAIFHGHAHAMETPMNVSAVTYVLGFILSTSLLHVVGIGFGLAMVRFGKISLVRFAGSAIACCGVLLFVR